MCIEKNNKCGFSLVEILIAIAIIGIVGAILLPNMVSRGPRQERQMFIARLSQLTQLAWQRALSEQKPYAVYVDFAKRRVWLQVETGQLDREGKPISVPVKSTGYGAVSMAIPEQITVAQFYIEGFDELERARSGRGIEQVWFYIVPEGMAQRVTINATDKKDVKARKPREFSLVLNPFTGEFKAYDVFQKP